MMEKFRYLFSGINLITRSVKVKSRPILLWIEPTDWCNLSCGVCQRSYLKDNNLRINSKHLTLDEFKKIFNEIKPLNIELTGLGEPFLNPDFVPIIQFAGNSNGAKISAFTNMTVFNKELAREVINSSIELLRISVDAAKGSTYEKVRGGDWFSKVSDNISTLTSLKKKYRKRSPFLRLSFVIQEDNFDEIADFVRLSKRLDVDGVFFQLMDFSFLKDGNKASFLEKLDKEKIKTRLKESQTLARKLGVSSNLAFLIQKFDYQWERYEGKNLNSLKARRCIFPWIAAYISVYGEVKPCCMAAPSEGLVLGNIFEEKFEDIWNGQKFQKIRSLMKKGKYGAEICRECTPKDLTSLFKIPDLKRYI